ncbi:hypothetical protein Daesc_006270 [Daldinia eschscholtzii]|uniref:Uncharacterized protein n=1 Tax=Daldinia eschscholtzii TaxID=292717 RepID=A0AAX6MH51_9PEZI
MSKQPEQQPEQIVEKKQLWEINDVILNNNYSPQETDDGIYYKLVTNRSDLPVGFSEFERFVIIGSPFTGMMLMHLSLFRKDAIEDRENAEMIAISSGNVSQSIRHVGGTYDPNYQLPSQRIAHAHTIQQVLSSGKRSKDRRGKGEGKN